MNSLLGPEGRWSHDSRNSICMQRCILLIYEHKQMHAHAFYAPLPPHMPNTHMNAWCKATTADPQHLIQMLVHVNREQNIFSAL